MYTELNIYFDARVNSTNSTISGTVNDYFKPLFVLSQDEMSENEKDKSYMLKIENYKERENEAPAFDIDVILELSFLIPNADLTKYQPIIDNYIHALVKNIWRYPKYVNAGNTFKFEVLKVGASDLNVFEKGDFEAEYKPKITVSGFFIDAIPLDLAVPSAPTLTSPANNYVEGVSNQSFNWTGTAETFDFKIVLNGTETILQTGLNVSSFTIPPDSLLADGTYTWTARGRNAAGVGDWATAFTVTIDSTLNPVVVSMTPLEVGLDDLWVRGDDITLVSSAVSSWNDKSGHSRHLTNSTAGNRPITETLHGKTFVKFEGTVTAIRNLSFNDSAHLFKMTGTQTRTWAFAIYTRDNTLGRSNAIMGRSNNGVGDEWYFRIPTNAGSSPSFTYYGFPKGSTGTAEAILPESTGVLRHVILEVVSTAVKIYVDSVLVYNGTVTFNADPSLPATASTFLVIGGQRQPSASQGTFAGAIGDISTGDKVLSADEVASLYLYHCEYYGI